jgi:hypothetical protein
VNQSRPTQGPDIEEQWRRAFDGLWDMARTWQREVNPEHNAKTAKAKGRRAKGQG